MCIFLRSGKHRQNYHNIKKKVKSRHSFSNMLFLSTTLLLLALESSRDSDVRSAVSSCPEGKQRSFGGSWQLAGADARAIVHPSLVIHTTSSAVCAAGIGVIARAPLQLRRAPALGVGRAPIQRADNASSCSIVCLGAVLHHTHPAF